jgi:serine/threonine protein kinase
MGHVYRARDTRLQRTVAIKVLSPELSGDIASRDRFEREARSIASLNHPHICTLYDVGDHAGNAFLVMELLEGQTLASRLARVKGGLPVAEALSIATAVADALAFAHRHHIVHRDIKPANIMLTPTGVKLLDFGLARLRDRDEAAVHSRTQSSLSEPHHVMGTLVYMSPEQLDGRADERSDIFGFGAVLFEMLTGRKASAGDTSSAVIAGIVHTEPPQVSSIRPDLSPALDRVVRRCVAKDPDARWQSAADLVDELRWIANGRFTADQTNTPPVRHSRVLSALVVTSVLALVGALIAWAPWQRAEKSPSSLETRTEIVTPTTEDPTSFALSPDGRQIIFVATSGSGSSLWLRSLSSTEALPVAGTEGATSPFWSPDSRSVGFFAANALKRLDLGGGAPQTLAPINVSRGGTWGADGVIVFAPNTHGPLMRISAIGGDAAAATTIGAQQFSHQWPHALPGGRQFLYYVQGTVDTSGIYVGALDGSAASRLSPSESAGVFLADDAASPETPRGGGWLLWVRAGSLIAQRLDVQQRRLTREPIALGDGLAVERFRAAVSVAAGAIAYRREGNHLRQLAWFDRSGKRRGTIGDPDRNDLTSPRVSPEGRRVVVSRKVHGNIDVWLLEGAVASRFTFDAAADLYPLWSPDGTRIVFRSNRTGPFDLYQKSSSGGGVDERIVASNQHKAPTSWSADGRFLMYPSFDPTTSNDLWVVPMVGDRTPKIFLKTSFSEAFGVFSPDGRWVAYESNESGRTQVYVRPFVLPSSKSGAAGQWQVSASGGMYPVWHPDGKELYYIDSSGTMMAAPIMVTGSTLQPGTAVRLFPTRIVRGGGDTGQGRYFDVARDGRFLINTVVDDAAAPITLVMNWRAPH